MPRRSSQQPTSKKAAGKTAASKQRLQRLLASAGFGSRRQCEELIEAGRVDVDGDVVTKLGTTVDPATSKVRVDGVLLKKQKLVYYAVNKPIGVVTTNSDPQGRPRVVDLVPQSERVFAVGRLDRSSEGLILLTNDGDLAQKLTHPKFGVRKVYRVTVAGRVDRETMKQMRHGIYIAEGRVRVEGARIFKTRSKATEMEIVLREGKNREIRRILARLGHKVLQLRRIAVGPLRLGDMPPGAYRVVSREEVRKLQKATDPSSDSPVKKGARRGKAVRGSKKKTSTRSQSRHAGSAKFDSTGKGTSGGAPRTGAVIGADPVTTDDAPRKKAKRAGKKRTAKRATQSTASRSAKKRRPTTKSGPKRKSAKKRSSTSAASRSNERARGKSQGKKASTRGRSTKKRVTRKRKK